MARRGRAGSPGLGANWNSMVSRPCCAGRAADCARSRCIECGEGDVEAALLEAEVGELLAGGLAELGNDFAALAGEGLAGLPERGLEVVEVGVEAGEGGVALLEALELALGVVAEGEDFGECGAVFAFEGVEQVEAFFQFLQAGGVNLDLVGVMREAA